jgi:hypothetical protein
MLRAAEKVKQHTSEKVYRSFCKGFNGDRSLRDLACLMKKDLLRISKSLLPYIRRGWIELIEIPDRQRQYGRSSQVLTNQASDQQAAKQTDQPNPEISLVVNQSVNQSVNQDLSHNPEPATIQSAQVWQAQAQDLAIEQAIVKPKSNKSAKPTIANAPDQSSQSIELEIKPAPELEPTPKTRQSNSQSTNLTTIFPPHRNNC